MSPEREAAAAAAVEEQGDDSDLERVVREVGALKDDSDLEGWAPPQRGLQQQNSGPAGAAAAGVGAAGAVLPPLDAAGVDDLFGTDSDEEETLAQRSARKQMQRRQQQQQQPQQQQPQLKHSKG